ncbi:pyridoxamine 5'-phosphate oxidase family protein [Corynebacterium sp. 319]|uniref:pyridoxamine 5'-phosphate oxidase family protein n=1 Tax=unclassified Corynebacterium TaxID=2624378 RepID=UPI00125CD031|nr:MULTISPECIES: pyridoxamine 5'-phosphate oxidase family protein [unclassified Corynebacterium]KAB1551462.1 pyridoxamine 5'-phosphate oxidase family protein [Corynebacterium sp. 321]KAB1551710.1 pyridoxamine 5'-phosphate oxidase family protein [Corynebacterium sp. 319]KAB3538700.1 pyridoxamine 5'-phosphate oxidase family protein [Corynebacterium sp. 366]
MADYSEGKYADIAFDDYVIARQEAIGAHNRVNDTIGGQDFEFRDGEVKLIRSAQHFFLSTVTGAGWPYVQHRGGPPGFVHVLDHKTLAFPEFQGNMQFVTAGNVDRDGRVCLFFVDYPTRYRLKVFGHARFVEAGEDPEFEERIRDLGDSEIRAKIERIMVITVTATDKNCSKQIKPRYTEEQIQERLDLYRADIKELKSRVAELEAQLESAQGS